MTKTITANRCPHPTCGKRKARDKYACYDHWVELPKEIRNEIWKGYEEGPLSPRWLGADKMALEFWKTKPHF